MAEADRGQRRRQARDDPAPLDFVTPCRASLLKDNVTPLINWRGTPAPGARRRPRPTPAARRRERPRPGDCGQISRTTSNSLRALIAVDVLSQGTLSVL